MTEEEILEKQIQITQLLGECLFPVRLLQFFDLASDKLLDEKIEVLTELKGGKSIDEIPNFYDILENYPAESDERVIMWD